MLLANSADQWEHLISTAFVPLALGRAATTFSGSVEQAVLSKGVALTDVRTRGGSVVIRSDTLVRRCPQESFLFSLHLIGSGAVLQGDRQVALRPGAGALYNTARPYQLVFPGNTRELVLSVSRQALQERLGRLDGRHDLDGRHVPCGSPAVTVLAAFLQQLAAAAPSLDLLRLSEFGRTAIDLLATTLRATGEDELTVGGRQAMLSTMREYVAQHFADPGLTLGRLARVHGVSRRYMAELFADGGVSPAACIREQRLEAAHRALTDPRVSGRSVAATAALCGFSDRTTFTRAFVRRFGVTPNSLRGQTSA